MYIVKLNRISMKNILVLIVFAILSGFSAQAQSDSQSNNLELEITEEGKRLEATLICLDAIEVPTKYNAFAKQFISLANFPQKTTYKTNEELRKAIDNYFVNHPNLIDKIRSERKKAHDKLYGERPY